MAERIPDCHPNMAHAARGLCKSCYMRQYMTPEQGAARSAAYRAKRAAEGNPVKTRMTVKRRMAAMLGNAQMRARRRGYECNLVRSDIIIPATCPVLGIPLDPLAPSRGDALPSLDRIDNAHGYVRGNVWVISWKANQLKASASLAELRMIVRALEEQERRSFRAKSHLYLTRAA